MATTNNTNQLKVWLKNGKVIVDTKGSPILCKVCPCDEPALADFCVKIPLPHIYADTGAISKLDACYPYNVSGAYKCVYEYTITAVLKNCKDVEYVTSAIDNKPGYTAEYNAYYQDEVTSCTPATASDAPGSTKLTISVEHTINNYFYMPTNARYATYGVELVLYFKGTLDDGYAIINVVAGTGTVDSDFIVAIDPGGNKLPGVDHDGMQAWGFAERFLNTEPKDLAVDDTIMAIDDDFDVTAGTITPVNSLTVIDLNRTDFFAHPMSFIYAEQGSVYAHLLATADTVYVPATGGTHTVYIGLNTYGTDYTEDPNPSIGATVYRPDDDGGNMVIIEEGPVDSVTDASIGDRSFGIDYIIGIANAMLITPCSPPVKVDEDFE